MNEMTKLSVNINKVALLRNSRTLGIPSVLRAAQLCLQAGAHGITVHPRPDQRHIRTSDVYELAALLKDWPDREFNIEGNPFHNLMELLEDLCAKNLKPQQCTFVPDSTDQLTSDHGWRFPEDAKRLTPVIARARELGIRVSLFMDPDPSAMEQAKAVGADRVELYTESYAQAFSSPRQEEVKALFTLFSQAAAASNLGVNAGHDLNRDNLKDFVRSVPGVQEVSIGHALIADALELGYSATVKAYLECL